MAAGAPACGCVRSPAGAPGAAVVLAGLRDGADVLSVTGDRLAAEDVALREAVVRLAVGQVLEPAALGDVAQQPTVPVLRGLGRVGDEVDGRPDGRELLQVVGG